MENCKVPQAALDRMVGFIHYCGGELLECGQGGVLMRVAIQPHHCNFYGKVHGGLISTIMDATAGLTASFAGAEQRSRKRGIVITVSVAAAVILVLVIILRMTACSG